MTMFRPFLFKPDGVMFASSRCELRPSQCTACPCHPCPFPPIGCLCTKRTAFVLIQRTVACSLQDRWTWKKISRCLISSQFRRFRVRDYDPRIMCPARGWKDEEGLIVTTEVRVSIDCVQIHQREQMFSPFQMLGR